MAFLKIGWSWTSNIVGAGASLGIVASLLVAMLGQARYLCVIGRARLVPSWLAKVHPSTGTPLNATIFLGEHFCFSRRYLMIKSLKYQRSVIRV